MEEEVGLEEPPVKRPYVTGSQALLEKRPRRRDDVEETSVEEKGASRLVLLHPEEGRYLELTESEAAIWKRLDGTRTVRELIAEALGFHEPLGPEKVGQALLKMAREGLLTGSWGAPQRGRRAIQLGRIDAQQAHLDKAFRVFVGFFLAFLPLCGFLFLYGLLSSQGVRLFPEGGSVWGVFIAALLAVSWRQVVQGCAVLLSGRDIPSWGLGLLGGMPALFFDTSSMLLASRAAQIRVQLAGLYAPLALSAIAALLLQLKPAPLPAPFLAQLATVGLLALFVDISPVYDTDGYRLYQLLFGQVRLRERAFTFLSRRFTRKLFGERLTKDERALLLYAGAGLLWSVAALQLGAHLYKDVSAALAGAAAGPVATRAALAAVLAFVLAAFFYALGLLVYIPVSWFVRPVGRRMLAGLVTPFAVVLAVGLVVFCNPATARLVCAIAGFITVFPLMRARKTFAGSPIGQAMFALGLFAAVRALGWAAGVWQQAGTLPADTAAHLGMLTRLSAVFLLIAAWRLLSEGALVRQTSMESAITRVSTAALALIAGYGLWQRPTLFGALEAFDLVSGVGVAIAVMPVVLAHAASPMAHFWRPLGLSLLSLAAAGAFGFSVEPGAWPAAGSLRWEVAAWPLAIAAAVASRLWLDHQWRRPAAFPRPSNSATGQREMLVVASQVLVESMINLFQTGLGERKTDSMVRAFNRRAERELKGEVLLVSRELDVAGWENHGVDWLASALEKTLLTLDSVIVERAGRRFADWVRATSLDDLYWYEQELMRHHLPRNFPTAGEAVSAADRLDEIAASPFFTLLSDAEFGALMRVVRLERYHAGDRVVTQGEPADKFYVVGRGELTVFREDESGEDQPLGHLVAGDCFGEAALVRSGKRAASVVACDDVELYTLARADFEKLAGDGEKISGALETIVRMGGFLRQIPMLSVLPAAEIGKLAARLQGATHQANNTMLKPSEPVDRLYLVQDGRVAVYAEGEKGGRERATTLSTGQYYGHRALLGGQDRGVSMVAESRARVLTLSQADFDHVMGEFLRSFNTLHDLATPRAELE